MKEIYPVVGSTSSSEVSVSLSMSYPFFDIYPAAYPHIAPYPVAQLDAVTSKQRTGYPHFDLYPAVMPAYDAAAAAGAVTSALAAVVLTKAILDKPIPIMESTSVTGSGYPYFDLYPANYATAKSDGGFTVDLPSRYPCLVIYRPVYPALEIYPAVPKRRNAERGVDVVLAVAYPCFDIYPAVYPAFDIYRSIPHDCVSSSTRGVTIRLTAEYPAFEIYPDVYPALEIYPSVPKVCGSRSESRGISVRLTPSYPYFDLYPATYPYFSLWPTTIGEIAASVRADTVQPRERRQSRFTSADLASLIRHSRTPEKQNSAVDFRAKTPVIFEVEAPSVVIEAPIPVAEAPTLSTPRTHLDLHRLIFSDEVSTPSGTFRRPNKTHLELHNQVFSNDVQRTAQSPAEPRVDPTPSPSRIAAPTARLRVGSVMRASLPPSPRPVGARPRSPISRSPIGRTPPALPQPNLPLPLPPASSPLNTTSSIPIPRPHAFGARPSPRPMSVASPDGPRRSYSTSARSSAAPDSMLRNDGPPLSRSSSLMLPRKMSTIGRSPDAVDQVLPSPPRRRESLVAQRVRAFQNQEPIQPTILEDGLSDFPMPPRSVPQPMRRPIS
ncbi:unnamed protein product [Mycena citricolor]|uniref:Uncharacterized protein n=1 Tax=Mycena citricolor TaxID=2018698 RepID=A0AAD2HGM3_9AGAR|nr:unnamed protein product [Mycena citricolor]